MSSATLPAALAGLTMLLVAPTLAADRLTIAIHPIEDLKAVFGTVESVRETRARVRISGSISDLRVSEGDRVTSGQILATVLDPKLTLQRVALDARIQSLDAQQRQAEAELVRARTLRASGVGSQQRLDDAQTALDVVNAQAAAMKADRAVVEQQLKDGNVLAPAAGRVLRVEVIDGAVVMPGEAVASLALDTYVLRLRLPERHARFIHIGDPVLVGDRGLASPLESATLRRGRVVKVYPEMSDGQVIADAEVPGLGDVFVGERVRVHVATGARDAIVVPAALVARRLGSDFVRLAVGEDGNGREIPVQVGGVVPALGDHPGGLEILSGLRAGDTLLPLETAR